MFVALRSGLLFLFFCSSVREGLFGFMCLWLCGACSKIILLRMVAHVCLFIAIFAISLFLALEQSLLPLLLLDACFSADSVLSSMRNVASDISRQHQFSKNIPEIGKPKQRSRISHIHPHKPPALRNLSCLDA